MADKVTTQNDRRVALMKSLIESLKADREVWDPLAKATDRYLSTLKVMQNAALQLHEAMAKVADAAVHSNTGVDDLGQIMGQMADVFKKVEVKRTEMIRTMMEDLTSPFANNLKAYPQYASKFEKDYVKDHKKAISDIKEAEKESAKAAKKGPEHLQQAIQNVNFSVKAMEDLRKQRLREAFVEQRRRYCFYISRFSSVLRHDLEIHQLAVGELGGNLDRWAHVSGAPHILPPPVEELVEIQQRTFVSVQENSYSDYYDDHTFTLSRSNSEHNISYNDYPSSPPPSRPPQSDSTIRTGDTVRAVYSYNDGGSDKLIFYEGETFTVTEADGSGWCLGEHNGALGWFPANYVEKVNSSPTGYGYGAPPSPFGAPAPPPPPRF